MSVCRWHVQAGVRRSGERGAVLYVALLLLLLVTMLAIGGAVTASFELLMAGNAQHRDRALAASEYAVGQALAGAGAGIDTGDTLRDPARPVCGDDCRTPGTGDPWNYAAWYDSSAGGTPVPGGGHSLGAGMEAHHFVIEASGVSARGARSEVTQGYYVVGPADD